MKSALKSCVVPTVILAFVSANLLASLSQMRSASSASAQRVRDDAAARLRLDNELRATVWAAQAGVPTPLRDGDVSSIPVKPWNLTEAFIGDGGYEYLGRVVAIPLVDYDVRDGSIYWHVGSRKYPAVIEMRFDAPPVARGRIWVEGRVTHCERDGKTREHPRVTFVIIVSDCHLFGGN